MYLKELEVLPPDKKTIHLGQMSISPKQQPRYSILRETANLPSRAPKPPKIDRPIGAGFTCDYEGSCKDSTAVAAGWMG